MGSLVGHINFAGIELVVLFNLISHGQEATHFRLPSTVGPMTVPFTPFRGQWGRINGPKMDTLVKYLAERRILTQIVCYLRNHAFHPDTPQKSNQWAIRMR